MNVAICEYGAGNVRSVELALRRLGTEIIDDVGAADVAVLPGVGSAAAALAGLRARGHRECRGEYWRRCEGRVPRMGWAPVGDRGTFYFAHSYAADTGCATAWSEGLVAEVRHGSFVGCQFHPEKSGPAGAAYLEEVLCRFPA